MSELTDLEICKRIAEIEGKSTDIEAHLMRVAHNALVQSDLQTILDCYNPLTDKALCFDLMIKHKIDMVYVGNWSAWCAVYDGGELCNANPQRAICLAIIAKHK